MNRWLLAIVFCVLIQSAHSDQADSSVAVSSSTEPLGESKSAWENFKGPLPDWIKNGKLLVNIRPRYEYADSADLKPSNAFTLRTAHGSRPTAR